MPSATAILPILPSFTDEIMPPVANLQGIERMAVAAPSSVEPALIVNEIAEELISEPATGETLYRAQLKVVRRMHELISQGIIMPNSAITSTTSDVTWQIWVNNSISTVAFSPSHISMGTGNVTASCGTTTIVWNDWNEQYVINAGQILVPPKVSEEERARREAQARAYQEEMVRKDAERRAAEIKADALLHSCLSAEQKEELTKKNHFHLYVGKNKYRIERGISGNVKLINENDDRPKHQYCIHPVDVPVGDVMLAQKLLLETNEEEFLRVANRHW